MKSQQEHNIYCERNKTQSTLKYKKQCKTQKAQLNTAVSFQSDACSDVK